MSLSMKGYKGKLLYINLSEKTFKTEPLPTELVEKFIGGRGFGAKLLYDLLVPGVDPLGEKNIFMILTGPLTGTLAPGAAKYIIVTKSPATGGFLDSYSSGRLSREIKFAGYDGIILTGKAEKPTYLYIEDEKIIFVDASHLWGKDNFDTELQIKKELGEEIGILTVGPAAENLVKFASVNSDFYRQAARGGGGAALAAKYIKAIAVKGTGCIEVNNIDKIFENQKKYLYNYTMSQESQNRVKYGTTMTIMVTNAAGMLPTRNFQTGQFKEAENNIDTQAVYNVVQKTRGCYACVTPCGKVTRADKGLYKGAVVEGPEYETLGMLGANLGVTDLSVVIKANELCDRLSLDTISTGAVLSFAMECYEKGILSREELNGLDFRFGNGEAIIQMIEDIAYRRGIGDILAEGVKKAAEKIGRGSAHYAMHVKGLEFAAYDPRAAWGAGLAYAVNPRGACHRRAWPPGHEILGDYEPFTTEGKAAMVREMYNENCYLHTIMICDFSRFCPIVGNPYKQFKTLIDHYAEYVSLVTGLNLDGEGLNLAAERIETQIRLFNVREGFTAIDDTLPERMLNEPLPDGPPRGKIMGRENLNKMIQEYYKIRGWDDQGVPTAETLSILGITR